MPLCLERLDYDALEFDEIMYYIRRIHFIEPFDVSSAKEMAKEVLLKTRAYLKIQEPSVKIQREKSAYYASEREEKRLKIQSELLKKFDLDIYHKCFKAYSNPNILDVGSGNGDLIFDRMFGCYNEFKLIAVDRDEHKVQEGNEKYGNEDVSFILGDVEADFSDVLADKMEEMGIEKFDIINISMLLLHLKAQCPLLRKLRRLLKPEGVLVIKDIDDGLNFAYPDDEAVFERIYRICDYNETSGVRKNGRQIYTNLYRAGFRKITLEKSGFSSIGLEYEEKEALWEMYFKFILGDIHWMHEKYPENTIIEEDCKWYSENYEDIFESFMKDDFVFHLGIQMYTAKK